MACRARRRLRVSQSSRAALSDVCPATPFDARLHDALFHVGRVVRERPIDGGLATRDAMLVLSHPRSSLKSTRRGRPSSSSIQSCRPSWLARYLTRRVSPASRCWKRQAVVPPTLMNSFAATGVSILSVIIRVSVPSADSLVGFRHVLFMMKAFTKPSPIFRWRTRKCDSTRYPP